MRSEGTLSDGFYASTGLAKADVPAEQGKVHRFDWRSVPTLGIE